MSPINVPCALSQRFAEKTNTRGCLLPASTRISCAKISSAPCVHEVWRRWKGRKETAEKQGNSVSLSAARRFVDEYTKREQRFVDEACENGKTITALKNLRSVIFRLRNTLEELMSDFCECYSCVIIYTDFLVVWGLSGILWKAENANYEICTVLWN